MRIVIEKITMDAEKIVLWDGKKLKAGGRIFYFNNNFFSEWAVQVR